MRAISLHQPWASLMAIGVKTNETRNRLTHIRGEVAICSTLKRTGANELSDELLEIISRHEHALSGIVRGQFHQSILNALPRGQVLCVVDIRGCVDSNTAMPTCNNEELACGDYSLGRFAWRTGNLRRLKTPVAIKGHQAFFSLSPDAARKVRKQL